MAWWQSLHATSTRRALLLTALGGLLIAGLITALPSTDGSNGLTASTISLGPRGNDTFNHAKSGDCLNWPDRTPDAAEIVDCKDEHRFEVAESVDMRTFPGSEYGPDAAPPSPARIQQISQEQCSAAVQAATSAPGSTRTAGSPSACCGRVTRRGGSRVSDACCAVCSCRAPNNQQLAFKGKVADVDQSKVWPAGTCLGIDPSTNQPTDIPVDCAAPHAMEVTGAVNLAEKFPQALPPEPDQDTFIKDACTRMTDAYLAPIQLRSTTLTLIYSTISLPSWSAGSHQVSCSIGATLGNGGWSTLLNSAKGPLMINGQPPVAPPDIPEERLNLPPIPMTADAASDTSSQSTERPDRLGSADPDPAHAGATVDGHDRHPDRPDIDRGASASRATRSSTGHHRRPGLRRMGHHRPTVPRPRRVLARLPARLPRLLAQLSCLRLRPRRGCRPRPRRRPRRPSPCRRHRLHCRGSSRVAVRMSPQRFDELVSDALDLIPPELAAAIDNVVVLIEDRNPDEPDLLGLYHGVALTERDSWYAGSLPDTITIYRDALLEVCEDEAEVVDEVAITVIHEIAHHFGIDDDRLHELGWG